MRAVPFTRGQQATLGFACLFVAAKLLVAKSYLMQGQAVRILVDLVFSPWFLLPNLALAGWVLRVAFQTRKTVPELSIVLRLVCAMDLVLLLVLYFQRG